MERRNATFKVFRSAWRFEFKRRRAESNFSRVSVSSEVEVDREQEATSRSSSVLAVKSDTGGLVLREHDVLFDVSDSSLTSPTI